MSISMKRNLAQLTEAAAFTEHNNTIASPAKRRCLHASSAQIGQINIYSSDDDSDTSCDDEDANESISGSSVKALQRSLRFVAPIDSKLSKAVSQYSDDEQTNEVFSTSNTTHCDTYDSSDNEDQSNSRCLDQPYNFDYMKKRSQSTNDILSFNYSSTKNSCSKRNSVNVSDIFNMNDQNNLDSFRNFLSNKMMKNNSMCIPQSDFTARSRCYEYLVTAIDEAWARYCDSTSYDENVAYELKEECGSSIQNVNTPVSNAYTSDEEDGYKSEFSATTSVTEYDSDYQNKTNNMKVRSFSIMNNPNNQVMHNRRVSEVPENLRLQELKDRFTKSKYFLEDLVDSDSYDDCVSFWNKWDLIKYSIVDFVEEDEEDEEVERKIEELEFGRFVGSISAN